MFLQACFPFQISTFHLQSVEPFRGQIAAVPVLTHDNTFSPQSFKSMSYCGFVEGKSRGATVTCRLTNYNFKLRAFSVAQDMPHPHFPFLTHRNSEAISRQKKEEAYYWGQTSAGLDIVMAWRDIFRMLPLAWAEIRDACKTPFPRKRPPPFHLGA